MVLYMVWDIQWVVMGVVYAGMKVVSCQKSGNPVEIIKPTVNFSENADFPPIGLSLGDEVLVPTE